MYEKEAPKRLRYPLDKYSHFTTLSVKTRTRLFQQSGSAGTDEMRDMNPLQMNAPKDSERHRSPVQLIQQGLTLCQRGKTNG